MVSDFFTTFSLIIETILTSNPTLSSTLSLLYLGVVANGFGMADKIQNFNC